MPIELPKDVKAEAQASLERYCREHFNEPPGNVAVAALLNFMIREIGPSLYNQGVADAQERLLQRVQELDIEVHEDTFPYWPQQAGPARGRRR
jgi:uncharacterized protein (DUF2164 family)